MFIKIFGQFKEIREEFHNNLHRNVFTGGNEFMSIAIRANQSGVDQAAAQKAAEKKGHQDVVKSVNAGGFLRKNDTQSQIEARRNNAKKQAL